MAKTDDTKRKVVLLNQSSRMNSGFGKMGFEFLRRASEASDIKLYEIACEGRPNILDPTLPWTVIHPAEYAPSKYPEGHPMFVQDMMWGRSALERVVNEEKPDVIISWRDHWMDAEWAFKLNLGKAAYLLMPCVDGQPQPMEWGYNFAKADMLFAYCAFGATRLYEQFGLAVDELIPPGVDHGIYYPRSRGDILRELGFSPQTKLHGFVGRNQGRKRFPELAKAFALALESYPEAMQNAALYLHTAWMDFGYDIHRIVHNLRITDYVYTTYVCEACGYWRPRKYVGLYIPCPACGENKFVTGSTAVGLSEVELAKLCSSFYWYWQPAYREGFGIPIIEAKAAGTPVSCTDYASMAELTRRGGLPIPPAIMLTEAENTMEDAYPSIGAMADIMKQVQEMSPEEHQEYSQEAHLHSSDFSWDRFTNQWLKIIRRAKKKEVPPRLHSKTPAMEASCPEDFVALLYRDLLKEDVVALTSGRLMLHEGWRHWVHQLRSGKLKKEQVLQYFVQASQGVAEHQTSVVQKLRAFLRPTDTSRVLVVLGTNAENVVLSTMYIHELRERYPGATIYLAMHEAFHHFQKEHRTGAQVIPYAPEFDGPVSEVMRLTGNLFQHIIQPNKIPEGMPTHGSRLQNMLRVVDCKNPRPPYIVATPPEGIIVPDQFLAVSTGASMDTAKYEYWRYLCDWIGAPLVQVGDPDDDPVPYTSLDLRGKLSWGNIVYILRQARLFFTNDNMMLHLGTIAGVRTVVPYGGTSPLETGLLGATHPVHPVHRNGCPEPCFAPRCIHPKKCLFNARPEDFFAQAGHLFHHHWPANFQTIHVGGMVDEHAFLYFYNQHTDLSFVEDTLEMMPESVQPFMFTHFKGRMNEVTDSLIDYVNTHERTTLEIQMNGPVPRELVEKCHTWRISFRLTEDFCLRNREEVDRANVNPEGFQKKFPIWEPIAGNSWSVLVTPEANIRLATCIRQAFQRRVSVLSEDPAPLMTYQNIPDGCLGKGYWLYGRKYRLYQTRTDMLRDTNMVDAPAFGWAPLPTKLLQWDMDRTFIVGRGEGQ